MNSTNEERLLKAENDAMNARSEAAKNAAITEYIAMMADIDIPEEEEGPNVD